MLEPNMDIGSAAAIASSIGSVAGLGWWLRGKFADIETKQHEQHEQNLQRFADIRVALTALGWRNGSGHVKRDGG